MVFDGKDITTLPTHRRSHIGMARSFQITSVFMGLSVIDNVALAVQAHDGHSFRFWKPADDRAQLRKPALEVLEKVGLANRAGSIASALSHGERRQLEIAMALATNPRFLLLDEPMAGMGVEESAAMVDISAEPEGRENHSAGRTRHGRGVRIGGSHFRAGLRACHRHRQA